jgi:hypothetical protein
MTGIGLSKEGDCKSLSPGGRGDGEGESETDILRRKLALLQKAPELKPGMLGIAHIDGTKASLWFVVTRRIKTRISELLLWW